jgi:hypothetical protein
MISYTRHGGRHYRTVAGPIDSDPDGNTMHVDLISFPVNGRLFGLDGNSFTYALKIVRSFHGYRQLYL